MKKSIFLDTSFLVASQVVGHTFSKRTIDLRMRFINDDFTLYTSPLVFDEFWYVLLGLAKSINVSMASNDLYSHLEKATKNILTFKNLNFVEIGDSKKELLKVIDIMKDFRLRPRDALIVAIMRKYKIKNLASFDSDFDRVTGISRIY